MAMQEANPTSAPSPQVVGNAFVEQYYHILHQSPDLVHRFYQDSSLLSRSDSNGVMKTVTTTKVCLEYAYIIHFFDIKCLDRSNPAVYRTIIQINRSIMGSILLVLDLEILIISVNPHIYSGLNGE
jgi:hypothetical protein